MIARQSTALTFMVGPVLDADGVAVTGGVIADFKISKNGAAPAAFDGSATLTHRHTGFYSLAATANDIDTVGTAQVTIDDTVNACPMLTIQVIEEAVYDALYAAAAAGYQIPIWSGASATVNLTGTTIANLTNLPTIPSNWLTGAGTAADFWTEGRVSLHGGDWAADMDANGRHRIVDGTGVGELGLTGGAVDVVLAVTDLADNAINAATFAADVDAEILSYIVDDATRIDASDLNSKIDSLTFTVAGIVDANVTRHKGSVPADLSTNGYYQAMVLRWLADNAAGTPNALVGGRVPSDPDGYDDDAVWVDPDNGSAGTTVGTNGTLYNPVTTFADAITICTSRGTKKINFVPGSTAVSVSSGTHSVYRINTGGRRFDVIGTAILTLCRINLHGGLLNVYNSGGQGQVNSSYVYSDIPGASYEPNLLSGQSYIPVGAANQYENVRIGAIEISSYAYFKKCSLYSMASPAIVYLSTNGSDPNIFQSCYVENSTNQVVIEANGASGPNSRFDDWWGNLKITELIAGKRFECRGWGKLVIDVSCTGGTIEHSSHIELFETDGVTPWDSSNTTNRPTIDLVSDPTATDAIYNRIGAPAGASIAADIAAIEDLADSIPADVWNYGVGRTLTELPTIPTGWLTADGVATDAVNEFRNAITGGAYALDTDANGRVRGVDGTGVGEWDLTSGGILVSTLASQAKADVNAEVLDVMAVDTRAEPGQGTPSATATIATKLDYLYKALINKKTQDADFFRLFNAAGVVVDQKAATSDDGSTFTSGVLTTGA